MVELMQVNLHNFLSFEDESFSFKKGKHLILGENRDSTVAESNGAGKSALFDAIIYAIYGKYDRDFQRTGTNDTYVELIFSYQGDLYKIKRYFKHFSEKNKVELYRNDELMAAHTKKETQRIIDNIFRLSYDNFISSVVYKQGLQIKISSLSPTERKKYFSRLVDMDFDGIERQVKKDLELLDKEIFIENEKIMNLKVRLAEVDGKLSVFTDMLNMNNSDDLNKLKAEISNLEDELSNLKKEYNELKSKRDNERESFISERTKAYTLYNQLKKLQNGVCPLCKQKVENIDFVRSKIIELEQIINKEFIDKYADKISTFEERIDYISNLLSAKRQELIERVKANMQNNIAVIEMDKLKKERDNIEKELLSLEDKLVSLQYERDLLKKFYNLVKPSGELRTVLLVNYIDVYNQVLRNITSQIFPENKEVKLVISDDYSKILVDGINYENLSGGEKRRLDFAFQIAFGEFLTLLNGFDVNIKVFDEVWDNLDMKSIVQIFSYLQEFFEDKAVYFITHNNELKSYFNSIYLIIKENGISHIQKL
jgi:DNA repair exonuclease SbcCD ATPase subunit